MTKNENSCGKKECEGEENETKELREEKEEQDGGEDKKKR